MKEYTIYEWKNLVNDKTYVGWTSNEKERKRTHKKLARRPGNKRRQIIHEAMDKYGLNNFEYKILDKTFDLELSKSLETYYILAKRSLDYGYNRTLGGETNLQGEELIEQHRKITVDHYADEDNRKKQSERMIEYYKDKDNYNKLLEVNKDSKRIEKIRNTVKKQWEDEEFRKKRIEDMNNAMTDEVRKKHSDERKKRYEDPEARKKQSEAMKLWWAKKKQKESHGNT